MPLPADKSNVGNYFGGKFFFNFEGVKVVLKFFDFFVEQGEAIGIKCVNR
jgi:hypothetical protein